MADSPTGASRATIALNVVPMLARERRPVRPEIDETALALLARHGSQILATARRYAATAEDAEDAYQRGLEILLTKAPTTNEHELVPWLKTVVKHEAFALRRQRERHSPVTDDGHLGDRGTTSAATHDHVERFERLSQGAEALRQLKPQEVRCLVLRAQGFSYREICAATGFSYTKVNRCLTEGRRALSVRVAGIEGGIECARFTPLLSALADGEARPEDLALLRPHMKTCLACRARLREFREAPARVAALLPPAALVASDGDGGGLRGVLEAVAASAQQKVDTAMGAAQHKAAALGERAHAAVELATGQKLAAVAASAAALAGGGTAVDHLAQHGGAPPPVEERRVQAKPVKGEVPVVAPPQAPADETPAAVPSPQPAPEPPNTPPPEPPPPPPPAPANEFDPAAASPPAPTPSPPAPQPSAAPGGGLMPAGGGGGGAGEFSP